MTNRYAKRYAQANEAFYRTSGKLAGAKSFEPSKVAELQKEIDRLSNELKHIETAANEAGGEALEAYNYEKSSWDVY